MLHARCRFRLFVIFSFDLPQNEVVGMGAFSRGRDDAEDEYEPGNNPEDCCVARPGSVLIALLGHYRASADEKYAT